ncbi:MAG: PIN domain-containing protein [Chloroflexi bacterium]|nr:PIN domain-containing protein [Chloroflexota bacterium]
MTRPRVPDTTLFIQALRRPESLADLFRSIATGRVWLSSVVIAELYAGTRSPDDALLVNRIVAAMERIERLLIPTAGEWARAGRLMGRSARLYGNLRPRDHLADVLILISAARLNGTVVTANLRHFERWAKLATSSGLNVTVAERLL